LSRDVGHDLDGAGAALFGSDLRASGESRALRSLRASGSPWLENHAAALPVAVAVRVRSAKAELDSVVEDLIRGR
jgi:hypothetical protein